MNEFLPQRDYDEHQRITAMYLPSGRLMAAKNIVGKNLYKLIKGFSKCFERLEAVILGYLIGVDLTQSYDMVDYWEETLAIPDDYFNGINTEEERRRYALLKLSQEGVITNADLVWLCSVYGVHVTVYPGYHFYLNPDPLVGSFSSEKEARFTIVFGVSLLNSEPEVSEGVFPLPFPYLFGRNRLAILRLFMREVVQANVDIRWFNADEDVIQDTIDSTDIWQDTTTSTDIIQDV